MGGLPKKAHTLDNLRKNSGGLLALDSGGLLFPPGKLPPGQLEQLQATAQGIVAAYNGMPFQAVAVSAPDLAAGLAFLLEIQKQSRFPWLSANIVSRSQGRHHFKPYTVLTAGGVRVGVLGLTGGPESGKLFSSKEDAVLLPWAQALPPQLDQAKKQTEMIVLLSSLPVAENRQIAARFPEIHIIFQSRAAGGNMEPQLANNTLITWVEQQGKHVGLLEVQWNPQQRRWKKPGEEQPLKNKKNELDSVLWQLGRYRGQGDPEVVFRDQPLSLRTYHALLARQKVLQEEINRLEADLSRQAADSSDSTFNHHFYAMGRNVPDHPETRAIVDATTRKVNALGHKSAKDKQARQPAATSPKPLPEGYAGSRACKDCHEVQWSRWRLSSHARAYNTLVAKKQQHNLRCLPCHVTAGFSLTGPDLLNHAEELRDVGCESCHGPAGRHTLSPRQNTPRRLATDLCLGCHTPEQSSNFNITEALARLRCGG